MRGVLLLLAIVASGPLAQRLPPELQAHISAPEHWQQVLGCHIHWLSVPDTLLPSSNSVVRLSKQQERQDFYLSLILWLLLAAALAAMLLSCCARLSRALCSSQAREASRSVSRADYEMLSAHGAHGVDNVWLSHLAPHGLAAALAALLLCTGRVRPTGAVWEVYVVWLAVMIFALLLQAVSCILSLPMSSEIPDMAVPLLLSVLPGLSESFSIFRDWLFIALAISTWTQTSQHIVLERVKHRFSSALLGKRTYLSLSCAVLMLFILVFSAAHLRCNHSKALVAVLMPIRHACRAKALAEADEVAVAEARVAAALSGDFLSALVQCLALIDGGSPTRVLYLVSSFFKIGMSLLL